MNEKLIELLKQLVKKEAIEPLKRYNKKYLKKLNNNDNIPIETVNLFKQSIQTINNTKKLLKFQYIVDAATLIRSAMEKIAMGMMIYFDSETYNEFKDLTRCGKGELTRPTKLLDNFKSRLNEINISIFEDFTDEEISMLFDEIYEKLCFYTHSSIVVSLMIEVDKNNDNDIFTAYFYLMVYFLELLLYYCIKHLNNDKEEHIDLMCLMLGSSLLFVKLDKNKMTEEYLEKYYKYLYLDVNKKYTNKYTDIINMIQGKLTDLQIEDENTTKRITEYFDELLNK